MSYNVYRIAKSLGGYRVIAEPDQATKDTSKELLTRLDRCLKSNTLTSLSGIDWYRNKILESAYAYMPGRTAKMLVEKIYEFTQDSKEFDIIYIDIKDFFGSITRDHVLHLERYRSILSEYPFSIAEMESIWELIHPEEIPFVKDLGIAQGNPLSPAVANLVCAQTLDHTLIFGATEYFMKSGRLAGVDDRSMTTDDIRAHLGNEFCYLRYCDNIFIVVKKVDCYSRTKFLQALETVGLFLPELETFKLKVQIKGNHQKNIILGMRLGATKAQLVDKKWLRTLFYRIDKLGPECMTHKDIQDRFGKGITYTKFLEKVRGLMAYVLSVDPGMEEYIMKHTGEYLYPPEIQEFKELYSD